MSDDAGARRRAGAVERSATTRERDGGGAAQRSATTLGLQRILALGVNGPAAALMIPRISRAVGRDGPAMPRRLLDVIPCDAVCSSAIVLHRAARRKSIDIVDFY
jgi:hypothetical protein